MKKLLMSRATSISWIVMVGLVLVIPFVYAGSDNENSRDNKLLMATTSILQSEDRPAQGGHYGIKEKVKKGSITSIVNGVIALDLQFSTSTIHALTTGTTSVFFGWGEEATLRDLTVGSTIYVFGYIADDSKNMLATKIVIANRSKLERVYPSISIK